MRFWQLNYRCLPVIYQSTHSQDQLQPVGNLGSYRFVKVTQSCKSRIGSGPSLVLGKIVAHGQKAARRVDVGRGWLTGCRLLTEDALPLSLRLYLPSLLPSILILSLSLFPSVLSLTLLCLRFASSFPPKFLPPLFTRLLPLPPFVPLYLQRPPPRSLATVLFGKII